MKEEYFRLKNISGYNGYLKFFLGIEKTSMAKFYKIPLLKAFINENELKIKVSLNEIGMN